MTTLDLAAWRILLRVLKLLILQPAWRLLYFHLLLMSINEGCCVTQEP